MKARTVVISPYWSYKSQNDATNHEKWGSWTLDDLKLLDFSERTEKNPMIILMVSPTALATGKHIPLLKSWDYEPTTVGTFFFKRSLKAGNARLDDSCMHFVMSCYKGKLQRRFEGQEVQSRHITATDIETTEEDEWSPKTWFIDEQSQPAGRGMTFGPEGFEYLEKISSGPFLYIFPRKQQIKFIPETWETWIPDKKSILKERIHSQ